MNFRTRPWLHVSAVLAILLAFVSFVHVSRSQEDGNEVSDYMTAYTGADAEQSGSDMCLMCHRDQTPADTNSHPGMWYNNPDSPMQGRGCELCHGPGGNHMGDLAGIIMPPKMSAFESTGLCSKCHADRGSYNKEGWFLSRHYQLGFDCFRCHGGHSEFEAFLTVENKADLCNTCHRNMATDSNTLIHHPVEATNFNCFLCHSPHSALIPGQLKNTPDVLCTMCHRDQHGEFVTDGIPDFAAGPVNCLTCHFGEVPEMWGSERCVMCHSDLSESPRFTHVGLFDGNTGSEYFGYGCEACHGAGENHFGEEIGMPVLREMPPDEITLFCSKCHDELRSYDNSEWSLSRHNMSDITCLDCHGGHSENESFLLEESTLDLCYGCHADMRARFNMRSHHPVDEGHVGCLDCHSTHSGRFDDQLREERDGLCFNCHPDKQGPFIYNHEISLASGSDGCLTCHFVHGSNTDSLTRFPERLCRQCHTDRGPDLHFPGTCWSTGCHTEVHGSNSHPLFFY